MVDDSGIVESAGGYRPFGATMEGGGGEPYGFTGEAWERAAELLFLRARWYQPRTGRFLSRDTWPGHLKAPQTFNLFVLNLNNPTNWADPSGHIPVEPYVCGKPQCYIFYFPGTGKIDNDYNSYGPEEQGFIKSLKTTFRANDMAVIFPFARGSGYREGFDYHIWPYYKAWLLEKQKRNWGAWPTNNAQLLQLENIRYDRYQDLVVLKATEVSNRLQQWGVYAYPGLQRDQVEIDFVAHSGGAHIALNTARYMPSGYKVDDVVTLGGLYKAHEWKETGSLASIGHFYDFVATLDEVKAMRDGLVGDDRFNYTGWHHDEWCDEECLGEVGESDFVGDIGIRREICCKNFDQVVNKTYVRKGDHHSGYWTHSEVLGALDLILCENKE